LYKINNNGTLANLPNAFPTACPYNATAVMTLSNNGYLAISGGTSSATIRVWKQAVDQFIALPNITHGHASVAELSFSLDAQLLAVRSNTTTSRIYRRKGDIFSAAAADITQPTNMGFYDTPKNIIFSPDGKYLFNIEQWALKNLDYVQVWKVLGSNVPFFQQIDSFAPIVAPVASADGITFSKDGNFFVIGYGTTGETKACSIAANDLFCNGTTVFDGYNFANVTYPIFQSIYSNPDKHDFSKNSHYIVSTVQGDSGVYLSKKYKPYLYNDFLLVERPFQTNGTTGASPVRAFDTLHPTGTGSFVAFAN
jgi:hypothetical protein